MILTCPECGTQYVVKEGAIPPGGRQVRCASCKHSWHQDPEEGAPPRQTEAEPAFEQPQAVEEARVEPPLEAEEDESFAEATLIEPRSGPEAEERAFEEAALEDQANASLDMPTPVAEADQAEPGAVADVPTHFEQAPVEAAAANDWREPPVAEAQDDDFTPYSSTSDVEPRRRSPVLSILIVVVVVIAIAAAFWFLAPPEMKARLGLAEVGTSPLALVTTHMDRQRLESGNELLTVTGRVINPTTKQQSVPPLQAQLKTRAGKVVYSWTISPPAPSLAPGESKPFNSAEVNVPPGGDELTITLGARAG